MSEGDSEFRIRPGRARSTRASKPKSFINQVLSAAGKSGHVGPPSKSGKRGSGYGRSTFGRGRGSFSRTRLCSPAWRVVVKARVVRHQGRSFRSAPLSAHLSYLKREDVSRDEEKEVMFDATSGRAFADHGKDGRHHFRFIVSPEGTDDMTDLREFTCDLARQSRADRQTSIHSVIRSSSYLKALTASARWILRGSASAGMQGFRYPPTRLR